ncbi:MAG: rane protein [Acidimicrobiales bacterium]|nr:rane protein [Acidimicrobiales bacterium]
MPSSNPALNDKIFEREIRNSRGGAVGQWSGSPRDEVPPNLFGQTGTSTLPPVSANRPFTPAPDQVSQWPPTAPPPTATAGGVMRLGGVLSASAVLLTIVLVAGWMGWSTVKVLTTSQTATGKTVVVSTTIPPWLFMAWIAGFGIAILTIFKPKLARITGPLYALAMGLLVGAISHLYEVQYKGIVLQAVGLTIGVFLMMLFLFSTRIIRVTDKLRMGVIAATGAVMLVYLVSIVLRLFGSNIPMIHQAGPIGILFSLVVVGIASFNLLLDFDFVEKGVRAGAPRYMEWYAAFGLMVTLIWLYLELLRLLSKLRDR